MTLIADITDEIVVELNAHLFAEAFTAVKAHAPHYDLKDMGVLHVTVVPIGISMEMADRARTQYDIEIGIAIQKKPYDAEDESEIDALLSLVEEIATFMRDTRVFAPGTWVASENTPIYSSEQMTELRQFTSVLNVTLRAIQ